MKTNSEIAHIWANELEYKGQQGNLFYSGKTVYSYGYHFPIAKHLDYKTVLFTKRGYSNSTSKHIRLVMQAISHKDLIFCNNPTASHEDNINAFIREILIEGDCLINSRKPEKYLIAISFIKNQLKKYLEYFNLKLSKQQAEKININTKEDYLERVKSEKEKREKEEKKQIAKGKKLYPLYVHNFKNGLKQDFTNEEKKCIDNYNISIGCPVLFKIKENEIESSKGVKIPFEIAKRYLNKFYNNEIKPLDKILNYQVARVEKNLLVIGCHNIYKTEIDYLKTQLN
jgi:hypothetical protein